VDNTSVLAEESTKGPAWYTPEITSEAVGEIDPA